MIPPEFPFLPILYQSWKVKLLRCKGRRSGTPERRRLSKAED